MAAQHLRVVLCAALTLLLLSLFEPAAQASDKAEFINSGEKRVAMVIGVADYQYTEGLSNTRNDAIAMAAALRRLGFDVIELIDPSYFDLRSAELDLPRSVIIQFSRQVSFASQSVASSEDASETSEQVK